MPPNADTVRVGPFELDLRSAELLQGGVRVRLQEQPLRILVALVERPGEVVTREELRQRLWPADTFVDFERSLNAAVKRLREALGESADAPRCIETLPRLGYRLIAPVEPIPDGTSPAAAGQSAPAITTEPARLSPAWRRTPAVGTVAAVLVVAAAVTTAVWLSQRGNREAPAAVPTLDPDKVVVAVFVNHSGDASLETLGIQISDWVTQNLFRINAKVAANPEVPTINAPALPRSVLGAEQDPIGALAGRAGAGMVLSGTYYVDGERLRVQSQLVDIASGATTPLNAVVGPRSDLTVVVADVARVALGAIAMLQDAGAGAGVVSGIRPPLYDAYVEWERAMAPLTAFSPEAERLLKRSLELDPTFVTPRLQLWNRLVFDARYVEADEVLRPLEAPTAYSQSTPHEQALTRFMRALMDGNWSGQLTAIREAAALAPTPYSLNQLSNVELRARRPNAALEAILRIQASGPRGGLSTLGSVYLANRALLHHELGQYDRQLEAARLGQKDYPDVGTFFAQEAGALVALGRLAELDAIVSRCERVTLSSGSVGELLFHIARELDVHGHDEAARAMAVRAAAWYTSHLAMMTSTVPLRRAQADALIHAGQCGRGVEIWRDLLRETPDHLFTQSNYATALAACGGSAAEARRIADGLSEVDRPFLHGQHLYLRARILAALGDADAAVRTLEASFLQGYGYNSPELHLNYTWKPLRQYQPFKEWTKPRG